MRQQLSKDVRRVVEPASRRHCRSLLLKEDGRDERRTHTPEMQATPVWQMERWLLRRLLRTLGNPPLRIALWNGEEICCGNGSAGDRLSIANRRTLWQLIIDPLFQFPEAYADGRIEIEGKLDELLAVVFACLKRRRKRGSLPKRFLPWARHPRKNSISGSQDNIQLHYDLGNEFYQLWLDSRLVYTCAYFARPHMTLEQAQLAKMDHVCRKLQLQPGMTVLETGCGWGSLALHMARHYGVKVRACNISAAQINYARHAAAREDLTDRVEFVHDDWRNMSDACDVFVSIGMLEHVGPSEYEHLGRVVDQCLRPGGWGLIHSIGQDFPAPFNPWIERRIFPGAYPPALSEATRIFEPHGFSVVDIENLRPHYEKTLRHWLVRFEEHAHEVREMFDEWFVRAWRMYLSGSIAAFRSGGLQLFQILFTKGVVADFPWTREYMYGGHQAVVDYDRISDGHNLCDGPQSPIARESSWKPATS